MASNHHKNRAGRNFQEQLLVCSIITMLGAFKLFTEDYFCLFILMSALEKKVLTIAF